MLSSSSEFKFYQSFRIPIEKADNLRFLVERENELGKDVYIEETRLEDISLTGLGFSTKERLKVGTILTISLQFKKYHLDLIGKVVRSFCHSIEDDEIVYGVEFDEGPDIKKFIQQFILSFSADRLKDCLTNLALKKPYSQNSDGLEMFSLLLAIFKDITLFGDKEGFLETLLEEVVRIMNAQRASLFLINPKSNELEAVVALGMDKRELKFDYRLGVAGSVFTTGVALNIDTQNDKVRFHDLFDKRFKFETKSLICYPLHNRGDKAIGVIEVINKRNQDRFTIEDEKTMKVLTMVFSSVFHNYDPMSEMSQIRRFSTPFDRKHALIGQTPHIRSLRNSIIKTKDIESFILIEGEAGVGKSLYAKIIHQEGVRGLKPFEEVNCNTKNFDTLSRQLFGTGEEESKITSAEGGVLFLREISALPMPFQEKLIQVLKEKHLENCKFSVDCRLITSSSQNLEIMVNNGEFNKELYEHISEIYISLDPLRRRVDDIEMLLDYFLKIECKRRGYLLKSFAPKMVDKLKTHDWPGNISELKRLVERAVLCYPKEHIISDLDFDSSTFPMVNTNSKQKMFGDLPFVSDHRLSLKDRLAIVEREMIASEVKRCNGNKSKAAKAMGISREALRKKLLISGQILEKLESEPPMDREEQKKAS